MEWIGTRMLDGLQAATLYAEACDREPSDAASRLIEVERLVRTNRDRLAALGQEFARIWRRESKPYALDWTLNRYAQMTAWYDRVLRKLAEARKSAAAGDAIPVPAEMELALPAG